MEFERGIYRLYDRCLRANAVQNYQIGQVSHTKKILQGAERSCVGLCVWSFYLWLFVHCSFVMDNTILKPAVEEQLKHVFYGVSRGDADNLPIKRLNYSATNGTFMFDPNLPLD